MPEPAFTYRGTFDENLPLPPSLTLEQYRHVVFRPDAHFVEGHILPRHLGDSMHGTTVSAVLNQLSHFDVDSCISLRLQIAHNKIRVCDIVVLNPDAPHEQVPTVAPLLCIEILSEEDDPAFEHDTLTDYRLMGVPNIWIIDPIRRIAYTFGESGTRQVFEEQLTVPGTPIVLDLPALFAKLDAAIARRGRA